MSELKNLRDWSVTPSDIAETYASPNTTYDLFLEIMRGFKNNEFEKAGDVTEYKGLERVKDRLEYSRIHNFVKSWVKKGVTPMPVKAILELSRIGIFPIEKNKETSDYLESLISDELEDFTYRNELIYFINIIGSIGFWRGSFQSTRNSGSAFSINKNYINNEVKNLTDKVFSIKCESLISNEESKESIRIRTNAFYNRLMMTLGFSVGRKLNNIDSYYPEHIEMAINTLHDSKCNDNDKKIAKTLIHDFILSIFHTDKIRYSKTLGYHMLTPSNIDKEISYKMADILKYLFEITGVDDVKAYKSSNKSGENFAYREIIFLNNITKEIIEDFKKKFNERVVEIMNTIN